MCIALASVMRISRISRSSYLFLFLSTAFIKKFFSTCQNYQLGTTLLWAYEFIKISLKEAEFGCKNVAEHRPWSLEKQAVNEWWCVCICVVYRVLQLIMFSFNCVCVFLCACVWKVLCWKYWSFYLLSPRFFSTRQPDLSHWVVMIKRLC